MAQPRFYFPNFESKWRPLNIWTCSNTLKTIDRLRFFRAWLLFAVAQHSGCPNRHAAVSYAVRAFDGGERYIPHTCSRRSP